MTRRCWLAAFMSLLVGAFLGALLVSAIRTGRPAVEWVRLSPPVRDSYTSWVPCVRTAGWLRPVVQCFPTEARSQIETLHGTDPGADCRLADPAVDCRRAGWPQEKR